MTRKRGEPLTRSALNKFPLPPVVDGDKETKGRILIVAGSREMAGAAELSVPLEVSVGFGRTWNDAAH